MCEDEFMKEFPACRLPAELGGCQPQSPDALV